MQIAFQIGAHCTDEDRLLKGLLKNRDVLSTQGIHVPGPGKYRVAIRQMAESLSGGRPSPEAQKALFDKILDSDDCGRMVLTNENFIGFSPRIFENNQLYFEAASRIKALSNLFYGHDLEFFIGIRNPATLIPAVLKRRPELSYDKLLRETDPQMLVWSDMIARIHNANPLASFTVWCNEDTPLIWQELLQELAGVDSMTPMKGSFDLLSEIMSQEGMQRLQAYLKNHPPQTEVQKRRIISAFLDKFAIEEMIEEELDLPGWSEEFIDQVTYAYEEDLYAIEHIPGVDFITP